MTEFEKVLENAKSIIKENASEEELKKRMRSEETQIILAYSCKRGTIEICCPNRKKYELVMATNIEIFMNNISLDFGEDELFTSADIACLIIQKQKLYIFMEKENNFRVYTISGKYAVWITIFNEKDKECIMFEPEQEKGACLLDILQENYGHPKAGEYILDKVKGRLKRKYESEKK